MNDQQLANYAYRKGYKLIKMNSGKETPAELLPVSYLTDEIKSYRVYRENLSTFEFYKKVEKAIDRIPDPPEKYHQKTRKTGRMPF